MRYFSLLVSGVLSGVTPARGVVQAFLTFHPDHISRRQSHALSSQSRRFDTSRTDDTARPARSVSQSRLLHVRREFNSAPLVAPFLIPAPLSTHSEFASHRSFGAYELPGLRRPPAVRARTLLRPLPHAPRISQIGYIAQPLLLSLVSIGYENISTIP